MELPNNSAGAPALPPGFDRELKLIDRDLYIRFHDSLPHPSDPARVFIKENGESIKMGRWALWSRDPDGRYHLIEWLKQGDEGAYLAPDARTLRNLRSDPMRVLGPKRMWQRHRDLQEAKKAKGQQESRDRLTDFEEVNSSRIREMRSNPMGKRFVEKERAPKIFSYTGQGGKDLSGAGIEKTAKEQGLYVPGEE